MTKSCSAATRTRGGRRRRARAPSGASSPTRKGRSSRRRFKSSGKKKLQAMTDLEGRYRLELPPGTYSIRISYELHKTVRLDRVLVEAGKVTEARRAAFHRRRSGRRHRSRRGSRQGQPRGHDAVAAALDGRRRQHRSRRNLENPRGKRRPGRPARRRRDHRRQPLRLRPRPRRALHERASNGAPLPSPEPDRAAIPLDVFPSLIIDSLSIVKTFTPDAPADFAGGSVRIQTRELPTKPLFQAALGLGYNDHATFRDRIAQRGSPTDWLGFDNGTRDLPPVLEGKPAHELASRDERHRATQGINSYMSTRTRSRRRTIRSASSSAMVGQLLERSAARCARHAELRPQLQLPRRRRHSCVQHNRPPTDSTITSR